MYRSFMKTVLISTLTLSTVLSFGVPDDEKAEAADPQETLSIGVNHLPESRYTKQLTKGVTHTEITRGYYSEKPSYTVDAAFYDSKEQASALIKELREKGYKPTLHKVENKHVGETDVDDKKIGYVVRSGEMEEEKQAKALAEQLKADGYEKAKVTFSEYDGTTKTTGPWEIDVLEIDPGKFKGDLTNVLAKDKITGREKVSSMAGRTQALAGMNGGYFVVGSGDGTPGDPAGISVVNGQLVSEAIGERTSLLLSGNDTKIAETSTVLQVKTKNGETAVIDGINRKPGLIRSCGGVGDIETNQPKHDVTCTDQEEIIEYNAYFGDTTPKGDGFEAVLNANGEVVETFSERGHSIPESGIVLSATGDQAEWLKENVSKGDSLNITKKITADGKQINTPSSLDIIGGGPQLVDEGKIDIQAKEEGFAWSKDFYYHFAQYRHPRSLAGIKENGNILLVTVEGRNPEESIGVSFFESAQILQSLGAVKGLNLDGGGSSAMVVNDKLVNKPSDPTGERPVSDGIFILK
ncbi:phosphodiester glycosidase family protein [Bacillus sp. Marseille-Q1617]|uniref:phosphodiester glycosidase family protein n=1 Tax=Bacillus sp. Marseille-Q1617 TaxID=2736887 RepID=UPI00158DAFE2|nr:phosphodiester glycosidase family protein [Bacillus sp. Marseille-Q1617]